MKSGVYNGATVMIPCFNAGDRLISCLKSVEQNVQLSHTPVEVILIDDASTDTRTLEIIESAKDMFPGIIDFRSIRQPRNLGQSAARNKAIASAKYQLILNVDADDTLSMSWRSNGGISYFDAASESFAHNPDQALFVGKGVITGGQKNIPIEHPEDPLTSIVYRCAVPGWAVFRRVDAQNCGGYPENLRKNEDWAFWQALLSKRIENGMSTDIASSEQRYYDYTTHDGPRVSRSRGPSSTWVALRSLQKSRPLLFKAIARKPLKTIFLGLTMPLLNDFGPKKGYMTRIRNTVKQVKSYARQTPYLRYIIK